MKNSLFQVFDGTENPEDLIRAIQWMDDNALDLITPALLKSHPNTYTYSKRLAECLVKAQYPNMPVCIARPSIGRSIPSKLQV